MQTPPQVPHVLGQFFQEKKPLQRKLDCSFSRLVLQCHHRRLTPLYCLKTVKAVLVMHGLKQIGLIY